MGTAMLPDVQRARHDYYARTTGRSYTVEDPMAMPGRAMLPMGGRRIPNAIPPRLSRVRSEELLGTRSEPDLRPSLLDETENCRWFVALFDYDHHMSPNPNAQQEELSFRKHQLIKVEFILSIAKNPTKISNLGLWRSRPRRFLPRSNRPKIWSSTFQHGNRNRQRRPITC